MKNPITTLRNRRIERLANWPTSPILGSPWTKRILSVLVVIGSWSYFLSLLPIRPLSYIASSTDGLVAFFLPAITLACFGLLRASLIRMAALPDEYLDEREIANRDWAYRLGYLVVRRLGLSLVLGIVFFMGAMNVWADPSPGGMWNGPDMDAQGFVYLREVANFIKSYFAFSALEHVLQLLALLTFTAYSFPIILLAWREAKNYEKPEPAELGGVLAIVSKQYFVKLIRVGYCMVVFLALISMSSKWGWNFFMLMLFYALYVFSWAMLKQIELLQRMKNTEFHSRFKDLLQLAIAVAVLGISVPAGLLLAMRTQSWSLLYSLIAGFVLMMLQGTSFAITAKLGNE
jgi:hypothetical protein